MDRLQGGKPANENVTLKAVPMVLVLACLWGGNSVAMKVALRDMPPFFLAGLRFALGAIIIGLWGTLCKIELTLQKSQFVNLVVLSLIFSAQICTFNLGTEFTTASRASIFINVHPFLIAILAHLFIPDDKLTLKKMLGLIIAFLGILIVFQDKVRNSPSQSVGDAIILLSGLLFSVQTIYTKRIIQTIGAYKILFWQMTFGLIPFFGLSLIFERSSQYTLSPELIIALLYQGVIVAGFAFIIWMMLLKRHSASKISAFLFATPLFGVGLSAIILQESVTPYLSIGATFVALGIYMVNKTV